MNKKLMFSSETDLWSTPQDLFDKYNKIYNFETDVCALPENTKCKKYFTPEMDGLKQEWTGVCWCNPPYGRLKFGGAKNSAPFPSMIVVFKAERGTPHERQNNYNDARI